MIDLEKVLGRKASRVMRDLSDVHYKYIVCTTDGGVRIFHPKDCDGFRQATINFHPFSREQMNNKRPYFLADKYDLYFDNYFFALAYFHRLVQEITNAQKAKPQHRTEITP